MRLNFLSLALLIVAVGFIPAPAQGLQSHASPRRHVGTRFEAVHFNNLGAAYMNQQQFARSLNLFRQAAALDPKLEIAKLNEAIALVNLQRYGAAETLLNGLLKKNPANARAWYTLGLIYKNQAASEKSLHTFEAAAKLVPDDPDVFYFIGLAYSELDQNEKAVAAFQHVLECGDSFFILVKLGIRQADEVKNVGIIGDEFGGG